MNIEIRDYDVISLDLFDTVLFRAAGKPQEVFARIWNRVRKEKRNQSDLTEEEYKKIRIEAERRARNKKIGREITLDEIYNEIPDFVCTDKKWLQELEVECEEEVCYANPHMLAVLREAAELEKAVVLLSDMYLNQEQISRLLIKSGIEPAWFQQIIISCEHGCSKQSGGLFQVLLQCFPDTKAEQILHIGDNRVSDYEQARRAGIHALHYPVIPEEMYGIYEYEKIRHNEPQKALKSLRKAAASSCQAVSAEERDIYEIGAAIAGPFLTMYISHVVTRLQELKLHRIYPFMREGYLLGRLLEREAEHRNYPLEVHPIYISRKVTCLPSVETVNREEIENILGTRNLTVGEAIQTFGLSAEDFQELALWFDLPVKQAHRQKMGDSTLREYLVGRLLEPEHVRSIERRIAAQRRLLTDYLQQEIGELTDIATIDIGFFGRIQMWMEQCLRMEKIPFCIKHFLAVGLTGDKVSDGMDIEGYYSTFAENMDLVTTIHRTTDIIEKLISVTEGSTIGYELKENRIVPVQGPALGHRMFTGVVFEGILEFQRYWHEFERKKPGIAVSCVQNRRETLMIMHRLIDMPRLREAELLKDVEADTNFGTCYSKGIITKDNLELLKEKGKEFIDRCTVSYTYQDSNIVWPQGVITLEDPFYYVRRVMDNNTQSGILKSMRRVVEEVRERGIGEIALYGAGENGRQFHFICSLYHIKTTCFIDRKESLWGTRKEGVPVMGLEEAMEKGTDKFLITSLFSIHEIECHIRECFARTGRTAQIFTV